MCIITLYVIQQATQKYNVPKHGHSKTDIWPNPFIWHAGWYYIQKEKKYYIIGHIEQHETNKQWQQYEIIIT
jgi:hypothetical protein